jgi:hypothetical protein
MLLLLAGALQAADEVQVVEGPQPAAESSGESFGASRDTGSSSSSGSGKKKDGKNSKKDSSSSGSFFKKGKLWGWRYQPYVTPGGGLSITGGGTAIVGGADVGVKYWKKQWQGNLTAGGSYTTGDALTGYDIHGGNEFGRREKWWGVTAGAMLFYNGYVADNGDALDPSAGLEVPVEVILGPKKYYLYGGVAPAWLFEETRHTSTLPFGDELEWSVGGGLNLKWITAEVGFNQRITSVGVINTPVISLSLSDFD